MLLNMFHGKIETDLARKAVLQDVKLGITGVHVFKGIPVYCQIYHFIFVYRHSLQCWGAVPILFFENCNTMQMAGRLISEKPYVPYCCQPSF